MLLISTVRKIPKEKTEQEHIILSSYFNKIILSLYFNLLDFSIYGGKVHVVS